MSESSRLLPSSKPLEKTRGAKTLAWDLPTRLFKWTLVALVVLAWVSSGFDDPDMRIHKASGYGILVLLAFRLIWGFVGGSTARFVSFIRSPQATLFHLKALQEGRASPYLGHNPVGGLMVLALLVACSVQVALGLMASDGVLASGPFADAVGDEGASVAGTLHSLWFYVLLVLAIVHIVANLYYDVVKREGLISAMVTGRKAQAAFADSLYVVRASAFTALLSLGVAAAAVYGIVACFGSGLFGAR